MGMGYNVLETDSTLEINLLTIQFLSPQNIDYIIVIYGELTPPGVNKSPTVNSEKSARVKNE